MFDREMKLVPINMDYSLLQFDALKFVLGVLLHEGLNLTLIFFNGKARCKFQC